MYDYTKFNTDMDSFVNDNNVYSRTNYLITTSLKNRKTYIYKKENKKWIRLYNWVCTIGAKSTPTITGVFDSKAKLKEIGQGKGYIAKWAVQIQGNYLYHSIIYDETGTYPIDPRLGIMASKGCIRLATLNAKWMYDQIPYHTTIVIQ